MLVGNILLAEDCYVLKGANPDLSDGTEENPHTQIVDCILKLDENSVSNYLETIYIGSGHYDAQSLDTGTLNIVGSGVNVTKIHSINNGTCFFGFAGTIRDLSFDKYTYWENGGYTTRRCSSCIMTQSQSDANLSNPVLIYNVLFKDHNASAISVRRDNVEIRNNVFADGDADIHFDYKEDIIVMNNLILTDIEFQNIATNYTQIHNNLFLDNCNFSSWAGSTYNLTFYGSVNVNGEVYGSSDDNCGQTGQYQDTEYFTNFDELNFIVPTWNIYNIYASGENTLLFDSGIHHSEFNDADGSRSDIGIMGGLYPWPNSSGPVITNFQVEPINVQIDGEINVNARAQTE